MGASYRKPHIAGCEPSDLDHGVFLGAIADYSRYNIHNGVELIQYRG